MSSPATSSEIRPHESDSAAARRRPSRVVEFVRERAWALAVWASMFAWSAVLYAIVRDHYVNFRLPRYDLGNMVQAVWSTAHGRPLEVTIGATGEQAVRLGSHVDPILAVFAPLWLIAPTPLTLVAVQVVAVALGALPVFWLARRHLASEATATLLAFAYLANPWVAWAAVDVFHPVTLAIPLFLFCVWFLDNYRLAPFAVCAVLVLATGELMGLPLAILGIWYAVSRRQRVAGFGIAALGVGWTLVAVYLVVPAFSDGSSVFYGVYSDVGSSPLGIVRTSVTAPGTIVDAVTRSSDVAYLLLLAVPLAAAFLLAPGIAAAALPSLSANLLAGTNAATTDPRAHYASGILPFLFAAVAVGLARLSPAARTRGVILVFALSFGFTMSFGPWPLTLGGVPTWYHHESSAESSATLDRAIALVPRDAPVSATNLAGSHLSSRRYFYSVPVIGRATWIVVDPTDTWIPLSAGGFPDKERLRAFQARIERSPTWRKVFDENGVLVFRKAHT